MTEDDAVLAGRLVKLRNDLRDLLDEIEETANTKREDAGPIVGVTLTPSIKFGDESSTDWEHGDEFPLDLFMDLYDAAITKIDARLRRLGVEVRER